MANIPPVRPPGSTQDTPTTPWQAPTNPPAMPPTITPHPTPPIPPIGIRPSPVRPFFGRGPLPGAFPRPIPRPVIPNLVGGPGGAWLPDAHANAAGKGGVQRPLDVPKSLTVYVGKIAEGVDDEFIKLLLEACGKFVSWRQLLDPSTNKSKGYGFVEYLDVQGVECALKHLNDLEVDGSKLLVKGTKKTEAYVEACKQGAGSAEDNEKMGENDDEDKLDRIKSLVTARAAKFRSTSNTSSRAEEEAGGSQPRGRSRSRGRGDDGGSASDVEKGEKGERSGRDEDKKRKREKSQRDGKGDDAEGKRDDKEYKPWVQETPKIVRKELERLRERERREQASRKKDDRRLYDTKVWEWERQERDLKARDEVLQRREQEALRNRVRSIRVDQENEEPYEIGPPWKRKLYIKTRRCQNRRSQRREEQQNDDLMALQDARDAQMQYLLDDDDGAKPTANGGVQEAGEKVGTGDGVDGVEGEAAVVEQVEGGEKGEGVPASDVAQEAPQVQQQEAPAIPETDPIYTAMLQEAKNVPPAAASQPPSLGGTLTDVLQNQRIGMVPGAAGGSWQQQQQQAAANKAGVDALFGQEEEEKQTVKLHTIQYTEQELKAMKQLEDDERRQYSAMTGVSLPPSLPQNPAPAPHHVPPPVLNPNGGIGDADTAGPVKSAEERAAKLREIADKIPTTLEGVCAHDIKWFAYAPDSGMEANICKWLKSKSKELLGAEDDFLVKFVCKRLQEHSAADKLVTELYNVFEEETETFILMLYRMVIYETEKAALQIT